MKAARATQQHCNGKPPKVMSVAPKGPDKKTPSKRHYTSEDEDKEEPEQAGSGPFLFVSICTFTFFLRVFYAIFCTFFSAILFDTAA